MEEELRQLVAQCIKASGHNPLSQGALESFCAAHGLTRVGLFREYSRHVAQEFSEGALAFWDGNRAMNQLGGAALEELEGFALDVFHAFDHGEYLEAGDPAGTVPWQRYTLPEVMAALAREGLQPRT
ncbi:hypothetical protein [Cognatilysobacter bugurensis]|uniref:Uncharacterized protein n=1 Tax=Cognatilysobacter bugurensis TaxID=543356 RepID=A0A918SX83_9GAMM|nr:hypothetical protein [Lysobacter bugurensis]GHA76714.1 hypothetical protein GCM10007067_12480 [Lysobacter bugurensis]